MHALDVARGRLGDLHAGPHRSGDGHHRRDRVLDQGAAGVAVAGDDVEHARRQELGRDLGHQQRGLGGRVARLEHDGVAGGDAPARTSRPPSSSGSSTGSPGRSTPIGSRRIHEVCPARYSPAARPSSTRAAPAKNRIWSTIGGISSLAVSAKGLPVFCASSLTSSSARASMASAILSSACWRSLGVVWPHVSKARGGRGVGAVDVLRRTRSAPCATTCPVDGSTRSLAASPTVSTYSPPTKLRSRRVADGGRGAHSSSCRGVDRATMATLARRNRYRQYRTHHSWELVVK